MILAVSSYITRYIILYIINYNHFKKINRKVVFERLSFIADAALGEPFGSQFQVKDHKLVPSQRLNRSHYVEDVAMGASTVMKDNRSIVDDGSSQCLSHKDIHDMKAEGRSGQVSVILYWRSEWCNPMTMMSFLVTILLDD